MVFIFGNENTSFIVSRLFRLNVLILKKSIKLDSVYALNENNTEESNFLNFYQLLTYK